MCGLVSVFGNLNAPHSLKMFELMLSVSQMRGLDSTGIAVVKSDGVEIVKDTLPPLALMWTKGYKNATKEIGKSIGLLGHNRLATNGKVNQTNAHPFRHKHITLIHNGVLYKDIETTGKPEGETDSETICLGIAERGVEEVWKELRGSAALIWWNSEDEKLYVATNGDRPLALAISEDGQTIYMASDEDFLTLASDSLFVPFRKQVIWKPEKDTLYSYSFKDNKIKEGAKKLEKYMAPVYYNNFRNHHGGNWYKGQREIPFREEPLMNGETHTSSETISIEYKPQLPPQDNKIVELRPNEKVDSRTFNRRYRECHSCKESLIDAFETSVIISKHIAICETCAASAKAAGVPLTAEALKGV